MALSEAVDAIEQCAVPDNAVVITFDDGYRDNYDYAYPILRSLSLPATIFLSSGVVGTDGILWHDRVFRAFHRSELSRFNGYDLDDPGQRQSARETVLASLKTLDSRQRRERIDELVGKLEIAEPACLPRVMLTWGEAREMARNGIGFGSHTVTHPVLSRIPPDEAQREIVESKRDIESNLQMRIDSFAYPNGKPEDYDEFIKQTLRDAGYRCAVTTRFGTNQIDMPGGWDPFELRRGGPGEANTAIFAAKLNLYKLMT
jgi:peptidoglycan/xylan/chitin deacetylase (PgdA/CDA1 family)